MKGQKSRDLIQLKESFSYNIVTAYLTRGIRVDNNCISTTSKTLNFAFSILTLIS
jgi:hypothetical protein